MMSGGTSRLCWHAPIGVRSLLQPSCRSRHLGSRCTKQRRPAGAWLMVQVATTHPASVPACRPMDHGDHYVVPATGRQRRCYDPRLRRLVREDGGQELARRLGIPRTTVAGWRRSPPPEVVTTEALDLERAVLHAKVAKLERRVEVLTTIMGLLLALVRISHGRLNGTRLPKGDDQETILRAVERARLVLPVRSIRRVIGLSSTRYAAWKRGTECKVDDGALCPKTRPTALTPQEVNTMREMTTAPQYRHVPTSTLAILAQRLGRAFVAPATWCRYVRDRGWRRPRKRVHPAAPKVGVRVTKPNGLWHVDTTAIRLLDGSKVYLRAVIDNCSRRILSWWLGSSLEPGATAALLVEAAGGMARPASGVDAPQSVMVDGGIENFNAAVDQLVNEGILKRILAQTDISASNSMIEAFFRVAKHNWLLLNELDTIATVRGLVEFYVTEHNTRLPHSAHSGRTPDEVYFRREIDVPEKLAAARVVARAARLEANRARQCEACRAVRAS